MAFHQQLLLFLLVSQATAIYYPGENCLPGWQLYNNHCYLFNALYKNNIETKTYTEAEHFCNELGGHLTSVLNQSEFDFLNDKIREEASKETEWYIGITDSTNEKIMQWTDGSPVIFTKLTPTTVNNDQIDCGIFDSESKEWKIVDCALEKDFICKRKLGRYSPIKTASCQKYGGDALTRAVCLEYLNVGRHVHPFLDGWYIECKPIQSCLPCPYGINYMLVYNELCDQCVGVGFEEDANACYKTSPVTTPLPNPEDICQPDTCPKTCNFFDLSQLFHRSEKTDKAFCMCSHGEYKCHRCPPGTVWKEKQKCCNFRWTLP